MPRGHAAGEPTAFSQQALAGTGDAAGAGLWVGSPLLQLQYLTQIFWAWSITDLISNI